MSLTVAVFGIAETQASLRANMAGLQKRIDAEIQYAGISCQKYAKQLCPVDTGRLRSSIQYVNTGQGSCIVDTDVTYAAPVEFGHVVRGGHGYVSPRPFLRPGFEKARVELIANLKSLRL